jgi:MOSC domain-containing protein YiiM
VAEELAIVSVNVAQPAVLLRHLGGDVISGIAKKPVGTPVLGLTRLNLAGDGQADTRPTRDGGQVHGGPDQAVYAFPAHHFGRLGQLAGQPVGPGFMGENLTVTGVTEHDVRIGDVWAWGPAGPAPGHRAPWPLLQTRHPDGQAGRPHRDPSGGDDRLVPAGAGAG